MTTHVFTREALYALVWAEPMRTIAARLGVSDVGLAKACRRLDVPVPERGYWAKLQHGKPTRRPALPKCKGVERVVIAPPRPRAPPSPAASAMLAQTPPTSIEVREDLRGAHSIVRTWIAENAARRRQFRDNHWGLDRVLDLQAPLQNRRLRLYSALFRALEREGISLEGGHDPDGWCKAASGSEKIEFRIYPRSSKGRRPLTADEQRRPWNAGKKDAFQLLEAGDLVLKLKTYTRGAAPEAYREDKRPLDDQLAEVVMGFRAGLAELKAWRQERADEARRYEDAAAARRAELERRQQRQAWRERLAGAADSLERAGRIRRLVAAMEGSSQACDPQFPAWRRAALEAADRLDPLATGFELGLPNGLSPDQGDDG